MPPVDVSGERRRVLDCVALRVPAPTSRRASLVAVDGVDGSGKSTFADELAATLQSSGRHAVRASADDFHRARQQRYRRGRTSPLGFWLDSYDYDRLRSDLLDPLTDDQAHGRYRLAIHNVDTDQPVPRERESGVRHQPGWWSPVTVHEAPRRPGPNTMPKPTPHHPS